MTETSRTLQGHDFLASGPSHYRLAIAPVIEIAFVGDQWQLYCPMPGGEVWMRPFPSLAEAVSLVAFALDRLKSPPADTDPIL